MQGSRTKKSGLSSLTGNANSITVTQDLRMQSGANGVPLLRIGFISSFQSFVCILPQWGRFFSSKKNHLYTGIAILHAQGGALLYKINLCLDKWGYTVVYSVLVYKLSKEFPCYTIQIIYNASLFVGNTWLSSNIIVGPQGTIGYWSFLICIK